MSTYRKLVDAVEDAIFIHQYKNAKEIAWFVEWWTGIQNINVREIERLTHKVATDYKAKLETQNAKQ